MKKPVHVRWLGCAAVAAGLFALGCTEVAIDDENAGGSGGSGAGGTGGTGAGGSQREWAGEHLELSLDAEPTYIKLSPLSASDTPTADWDLLLDGVDIFTNSGASGSGDGGAFGPLTLADYDAGKIPTIPFIMKDQASGAFGDWYLYDGSSHVLYSRFHTYGVRSKGRLYKVQVISYYGEIQSTPLSAVYSIRYAEVTEGGSGPVQRIDGIDATAGGPSLKPDSPAACLDLASGEQRLLAPAQYLADISWDICFRRMSISVNGELGGPGSVTAANLDADDETPLEVVNRYTADGRLPAFEAVSYQDLTQPALEYRGDRIISAFAGYWLTELSPPRVARASWAVVSSGLCGEGTCDSQRFLAGFSQDVAEEPNRVTLHVRPAR
ncbi:MAG: HmuY family protein [Polyangiaceae bacterium]|nr:HmuY family protein [Polyangiaceae bacterium]MCW5792018.1 HmuY family protein [Polyangiaceae bacterium]